MSSIEQDVNISTHSKAISHGIFSVIFERLDVCCLKNLRHSGICHHTTFTCSKDLTSEISLIRTIPCPYSFYL